MSKEDLAPELLELDNTRDLKRRYELATEIANKTSDPDLIREMEEQLKFIEYFHLI